MSGQPSARRGTFREVDGRPVPMPEAKEAWASLARSALERVAKRYNGTISYGDLAETVQAQSGVRTTMMMHYWIGDVLGRVARECGKRGEPVLASLCVHADGTIGDGYAWATREVYGDEPQDLEMHAAEERLKCYRFFGASLPPDGGQPMLTAQVAARRRAARRATEPAVSVCPVCFQVRSRAGTCACE